MTTSIGGMMTENKEVLRVWHERTNDGRRTGKTVAMIWDGDHRYVGVNHFPDIRLFTKYMGWMIAVGRARTVAQGIRERKWPVMFEFSAKAMEKPFTEKTISEKKIQRFLNTIPQHLYKEERQDQEHAQAIRSEFA
jgi:hypothetical protein